MQWLTHCNIMTVLDSGKKSIHTTVKKKLIYPTIEMAVLDHPILLRCGEATLDIYIYLITYPILQINNLSMTELFASVLIISQLLVTLKMPFN